MRLYTRTMLALAALAFAVVAWARDVPPLAVAQLPAEARDVLKRIEAGGPFRYDRDGIDFGNRERLLPGEARGYYREYTVDTPGLKHRGARRLVVGCPRAGLATRKGQAPGPFTGLRDCTGPAHVYYTEDHYQSFRVVTP